MKNYAIAFIGSASAHTLVKQTHFASKAQPADYVHMAAIGETYHSAWTRCAEKSTLWLEDELDLMTMDEAFDNGYYIEYSIKKRVPAAYNTFRDILGEDHYWPAPEFSTSGKSYRVTFADWEANSHAQVGQAVSGEAELPEPYQRNKDLDWIIEHNHPNPEDKTIEVYGGVKETELRRRHDGYKMLYQLFYNIQQTSYYCDFTLESAQFVFEKYGQTEKAKLVEAERKKQTEIWKYILKEQVAPVRWSMSMWTRYNIAEPSIHNSISVFNEDWNSVVTHLKEIDASARAEELGWENYHEKFASWEAKKDSWITGFEDWIGSCYNEHRPADDVIETSAKVCQNGITFAQIKAGIKESTEMWFDFAVPLLEAYEKSEGADQKVLEKAHAGLHDAIYTTGKAHSFRCEYLWILTRVRYFEIIPTWEIQRVARDTESYWQEIEEFRTTMLSFDDVNAEGLYSNEVRQEMMEYKDEIVDFLNRWGNGDRSVYDSDGELHRRYLRTTTNDLAKKALKVYNWYFNMAYEQMSWKDGEKHPSTYSTGYNWGSRDPPSKERIARGAANSDSRLGWRKWVWRELTKFHFHTWRRI